MFFQRCARAMSFTSVLSHASAGLRPFERSVGHDDPLAPSALPDAHGQIDGQHAPVLADLGGHPQAAFLVVVSAAVRACTRSVSPSVRRRMLIPLSDTSTRSTRSQTMRAC